MQNLSDTIKNFFKNSDEQKRKEEFNKKWTQIINIKCSK